MKLPRALGALSLAVALLTAGCGGSSSAGSTSSAQPSASGNSAFPVTVSTKFGPVTIEKQPSRVVALGWGDAETALALGVQPVGASDWLSFGGEGVGPWAAGRYDQTPKIIGTVEPSYEAIAALKPDLILDTKSSGEQQRHDLLAKIAPTVGVPDDSDNYLTSTEDQTTLIAAALGKSTEATGLLKKVDADFAAARQAHPTWEGRTFTAATRTAETWGAYIQGSDRVSFLEKLGMVQNPQIAKLAPNATGFSVDVSNEELKQLDADLIVAFPIFIKTSQITSDKVFQAVPAVKDGRAVIIDGDLAAAYSLGSTLALGYAIDNLVPRLEKALLV